MYINSGGGSVYSGLGLLDVMDFVKPDIITVNTGLAASMAAVILCSGTNGKRRHLKKSHNDTSTNELWFWIFTGI
jgi:ATP-dependent Clp protease protease subunit